MAETTGTAAAARNQEAAARKAAKEERKESRYKWIALSNTTLGALLASIDSNIILISLPAIFKGMDLNPLSAGGTSYMMWMMMGYGMITAVLLVSFGRLSDIFGRVRLYNLGFAIRTVASFLLFLAPGSGGGGMVFLIIFRLVQGVGSGFLFSNSLAIITDAFKQKERGFAMGCNQIAGIGGSLAGLILGGILTAINWHLIFLVSVPVGLFGTIWAYIMLKEQSKPDKTQKIDWLGNGAFAVGLTSLLLSVTLGIIPYKTDVMGWKNPLVIGGIIFGAAVLVFFVFIEARVKYPMFNLKLFKIRPFAFANLARILCSLAQGGLQFMLIIWLQGIWLPLHGYSFEDTPLWAGIYMLPMMGGFFLFGPLCGRFSDKLGQRGFTTAGMALVTVAFILLNFVPTNFNYPALACILVIAGAGMGMFAAPNTTSVMNSVPASMRGAAAGMKTTFQNTGTTISMALYFAILIYGMAKNLPSQLISELAGAGVTGDAAAKIASMPPSSALFAAFLGYNPVEKIIGAETLAALPAATRSLIVSESFFPNILSPAVKSSLNLCFHISAALSFIAMVVSFLGGGRKGEAEKV